MDQSKPSTTTTPSSPLTPSNQLICPSKLNHVDNTIMVYTNTHIYTHSKLHDMQSLSLFSLSLSLSLSLIVLDRHTHACTHTHSLTHTHPRAHTPTHCNTIQQLCEMSSWPFLRYADLNQSKCYPFSRALAERWRGLSRGREEDEEEIKKREREI